MDNNITASLGAGSGMNVGQLVKDLAAASRAPKIARITSLVEQNQARISAVSQARSDLDGLARSLAQMVTDGTLRSAPTASDANVLTLTAAAGLAPADFSGTVEVIQLARGQSSVSAITPSRTAAIGSGSLTLTVGGSSTAISIDPANSSLDALAAAINGAGTGVRANIVSDTDGFRLVLRGPTGAANAFSLTLDSGDPSLAAFASGPGGGLTQPQPASDAVVRIDGVQYSRPSNTISDILPGISLGLKKAAPGQLVDIGVTRPLTAIRQAAEDFVDVFNQLKAKVGAAMKSASGEAGLRQLDSELLALPGQALVSQGAIARLTDIGISVTRDGTLLLDKARLDRALASNADGVEALFNPPRSAVRNATTDPGLAGVLQSIRDRAVGSNGALERVSKALGARQKTLAATLAQIEQREGAYAARLERQFGQLDVRVGALRATQAYLTQQIAVWTGNNN